MEDVREVAVKEQFMNSLPTDKRLWVLEKKPKSCIEAGELMADEYEQVRRPEGQPESKPRPTLQRALSSAITVARLDILRESVERRRVKQRVVYSVIIAGGLDIKPSSVPAEPLCAKQGHR